MQVNSVVPQTTDASSTPVTSAPSSSSSASTAANPLADPNLFITLLTAQLQAQDPLNPLSPQDMVNQLTQVSSLQQLVRINQTLTQISTSGLGKTSSQTNPIGTTN